MSPLDSIIRHRSIEWFPHRSFPEFIHPPMHFSLSFRLREKITDIHNRQQNGIFTDYLSANAS